MASRIAREEYERANPRVRFICGWAYHANCYEIGVMWGRLGFEEARPAQLVYRRVFSVEFNPESLRCLRRAFRIVRI